MFSCVKKTVFCVDDVVKSINRFCIVPLLYVQYIPYLPRSSMHYCYCFDLLVQVIVEFLCVHVCLCAGMFMCVLVHMYACIYTYIRICTHTPTRTCILLFECARLCVCVCIYVAVCLNVRVPIYVLLLFAFFCIQCLCLFAFCKELICGNLLVFCIVVYYFADVVDVVTNACVLFAL